MPYWADSICPSDFSGVGKTYPWTSYVANTGYLDKDVTTSSPAPVVYDVKANGVFQDRARYTTANPKPKVSLTDIKDGQSTTLMISENVDACYYVDQPVLAFTTSAGAIRLRRQHVDAKVVNPTGNTSERGAGFIWWDTSILNSRRATAPTFNLPAYPELVINGKKGQFDPATDANAWPSSGEFYDQSSEPNYAARPASNHPGGVNVAFVGGNTRFLREDIDYPVYCLLMTSDGANCTNQGHITTTSHDANNHSWQKYKTLDEGSL